VLSPTSNAWRLDGESRLVRHAVDLRDADAVQRLVGEVRPAVIYNLASHGAYPHQSDRFSTVRANRRFSDMILSASDMRGRRVVDVGCGDGTYTALLGHESGAASVLGIDHVADPAGEINAALRLAPTVVFLEPNGMNPILKLLERFSTYHREHDERSYVASTYRHWIKSGGGRVRSSTYFGLVPHFSPEWLARTGAVLEPVIERIPGLRVVTCGQLLVVADGAR
jgi:hypothetical protein